MCSLAMCIKNQGQTCQPLIYMSDRPVTFAMSWRNLGVAVDIRDDQ